MTTVAFKLGGVLEILTEPSPAGARVKVTYGGFTVSAKGDGMAYTLPSGNGVGLAISYVDAHGNPATVDGDVAWASSDETLLTVTTDSGDSTKASMAAIGPLGQVQVTATADADLGPGVRNIITTMDVVIVAGEAIAGTITPVGESAPT